MGSQELFQKGTVLWEAVHFMNRSACHVSIGPIYTHAAGAAHLPDSPENPDNPDNPDSEALHLQPPFLYVIFSGGSPYILMPRKRHTFPTVPIAPGIPTTPIQKHLHFQPPLTAKNCQLKTPIRKAPHHGALLLIIFFYVLISFRPAERWKPGRTGCNGGGKRGLRRSRDPWQ